MTRIRTFVAAAAVLVCLSLAGAAQAQRYYSNYAWASVVPGHHFYQSGGYVSVPQIGGPAYSGSNQGFIPSPYAGSSAGFQGGYTGSVFGFPNYSSLGYSGISPYGLYNAYAYSLYGLSGYGVSNYVSPLGSYARPYTLLPSRYAPTYQQPGYYRSPLLYGP